MDSSFLARPFAALRPAPGQAAEVAAPPYDVLDTAEARALAAGRPHSFLHVSRAEIDLPAGTDPYDEAVYMRAAQNLARLQAEGVLLRDHAPAYYAYRVGNGDRSQTGIALAASVAAYEAGRIRRHELTRPAKENDRVRQIEAVGAITGPVLLVHRADDTLASLLGTATAAPAADSAEVDGWRHETWPITAPDAIARITARFDAMEALYIADGHHRSAAAARVAAARRLVHPGDDGQAAWHGFLAVSFADDELEILEYNRVLRDLNGLTPAQLLERLAADFEIAPGAAPVRPHARHHFGCYLDGAWYVLAARQAPSADDPVARLDVSLLERLVLKPLLGIADARTDARIDFIGGSRGPQAVAARVDSGEMAVGFTLYPTAIDDLVAIADAGRIMPPKSTWFEPKLADGLLSLPLD